MKKNLMLIALMAVSTIIFAQRHHGRHDQGKKGNDRYLKLLKKELLLTDDQYAKVKSVNENFMKQFTAIRKDTAMSQGKAQTLTKKIRDEQQAQMKSILNEPQWAKLNDMKRKGPRGGKGDKHPSHGSRPSRGDARSNDEERG